MLGHNGVGKGLVWLKNASWGGQYAFWVNTMNETNAHDRAAQLWDGSPHEGTANLSDDSVEGDWRLPTKRELEALSNGTEPISSGSMRAFSGVQSNYYWSSTTYAKYTYGAWAVYMVNGSAYVGSKGFTYYVWPVRAGQ